MSDSKDKKDEGQEVTRIPVTVDGQVREFTPDELAEHVRAAAAADRRQADLDMRERALNEDRDRAERMKQLEHMIQNDPDQAYRLLDQATGRTSSAPDEGEEDPLVGIDDDVVGPEIKEVLRAQAHQLRELKARDQQRSAEFAQERAQRDLDEAADRFPQYEGDQREDFKAMVAVMSSRAPNTPLSEIAEKANESIHRLVQQQTQRAKDERESREAQRQTPASSGPPGLTPPEQPFTAKEMRQGKVASRVAQVLRDNLGMK